MECFFVVERAKPWYDMKKQERQNGMKKIVSLFLTLLLVGSLTACGNIPVPLPDDRPVPDATESLPEDGLYTTKDDVALYIHLYGHLPDNFITKDEARALGWSGGSLEPYAPGKSIGGSHFGNYEGLLPEADGRSYTECDINTMGADSRGAERIVFSNDGLIYYTNDHYESFTLLYGEE